MSPSIFGSNQLGHLYDTNLSSRTEEIMSKDNHDLEELSEWLHQESRQTIEQNRRNNAPHFTAMMVSENQGLSSQEQESDSYQDLDEPQCQEVASTCHVNI